MTILTVILGSLFAFIAIVSLGLIALFFCADRIADREDIARRDDYS